jgi:hypothetical protein
MKNPGLWLGGELIIGLDDERWIKGYFAFGNSGGGRNCAEAESVAVAGDGYPGGNWITALIRRDVGCPVPVRSLDIALTRKLAPLLFLSLIGSCVVNVEPSLC